MPFDKRDPGYDPYKVTVFGCGGVGKSSITLRFIYDIFQPDYLPTIEDCYRKTCLVDGTTAFLDIMDTAGQEEYNALIDQWVREGKAFLLVFDVTNRATFEGLHRFRDRILLVRDTEEVPMVLVGNKVDLVEYRQVSTEEALAHAKELGIPYIECSALKNLNCDSAFFEAIRQARVFDEREKIEEERTGKSNSFLSNWCSIL